MTLGTNAVTFIHGEHAVGFYEDDSHLIGTVGAYLAQAVLDGAAVIAIATEPHRRAFEAELVAAGVDVASATSDGGLVMLDASATLAELAGADGLDPSAFRRVIGGIVQEAGANGRAVRAYGEMVGLLWEDGDVLGAIELERLWNELAQERAFSLLCGYHGASASDPEHTEALRQICHLHSSVVPALDRGPVRAVSRRFPAEYEAPRAARQFVAEAMQSWGHDGGLVEDARLVVSELASNAVRHAGSAFSVVAVSEGAGVRLSVQDGSVAPPKLRVLDPSSPSGRGMQVIVALTNRWGVDPAAEGKTVWTEIAPTSRAR